MLVLHTYIPALCHIVRAIIARVSLAKRPRISSKIHCTFLGPPFYVLFPSSPASLSPPKRSDRKLMI